MTEQRIFVYKLFSLLSITDFSLFFIEKLQSHPLFLGNPPLKTEVLSCPPLFEDLVGGSTHLQQKRGEGAHYVNIVSSNGIRKLIKYFELRNIT